MLIMSDSLRTLDGLPVLDSQREGCMRLQVGAQCSTLLARHAAAQKAAGPRACAAH